MIQKVDVIDNDIIKNFKRYFSEARHVRNLVRLASKLYRFEDDYKQFDMGTYASMTDEHLNYTEASKAQDRGEIGYVDDVLASPTSDEIPNIFAEYLGHHKPYDYVELAKAMKVRDENPECNACACAIGHLPTVEGLELSDKYIDLNQMLRVHSWGGVSHALVGFDEQTGILGKYCFSSEWSDVDNTAKGAARRIIKLLSQMAFRGYIDNERGVSLTMCEFDDVNHYLVVTSAKDRDKKLAEEIKDYSKYDIEHIAELVNLPDFN